MGQASGGVFDSYFYFVVVVANWTGVRFFICVVKVCFVGVNTDELFCCLRPWWYDSRKLPYQCGNPDQQF